MKLTERQKAILAFIRRFIGDHGYPPSIREIMTALGVSSTSVVNYNLNVLARLGYITRNKELARGIRLEEKGGAPAHGTPISIPLLGRIGASLPAPQPDSVPFPDEYIELTREIIPDTKDVYALQVSGDSMIDALIHDGDIVIMKHNAEVRDGDLVAVWLRDEKETTLKRLYIEGERARLQPANPTMQPIYTSAANVEVQGKVIMVIRQVTRSAN
jgi:repressor LexA